MIPIKCFRYCYYLVMLLCLSKEKYLWIAVMTKISWSFQAKPMFLQTYVVVISSFIRSFFPYLSSVIVHESVLEAASIVERFCFDENCFDKFFVDFQNLFSRVQSIRPVSHQQVAPGFHGLSWLKEFLHLRKKVLYVEVHIFSILNI